jgi:hypothetical protein
VAAMRRERELKSSRGRAWIRSQTHSWRES